MLVDQNAVVRARPLYREESLLRAHRDHGIKARSVGPSDIHVGRNTVTLRQHNLHASLLTVLHHRSSGLNRALQPRFQRRGKDVDRGTSDETHQGVQQSRC
ncbi:hypothetical protein OF83DRAFT_1145382 [Amylostereum chailletii]|nr:hypothetical protein OF83DRAFT_1145382 [Amylostereum chailletii]